MFLTDAGLDVDNGRYTISQSGIYGIFANVMCTSCKAPSLYRLTVGINGVADYANSGLSAVVNGLHGTQDTINVGGYVELREGDVVDLWVYSDTGTGWTVDLFTSWSMLMINEKGSWP